MTGYQEILTDPSILNKSLPPHRQYRNQLEESSSIHAQGLVIRDLLIASNFRNEQTLSDYLKSQNIVGIADIDTRKLFCVKKVRKTVVLLLAAI